MSRSTTFFTPRHTNILLALFQYFYLFSAVFLLLAFIIKTLSGQIILPLLIGAIISSLIAYGIYNKKSWVTILITVVAAYGIIGNLQSLPVNVLKSILYIAILTFEIYFINRKDVKAHFKARHTTIF